MKKLGKKSIENIETVEAFDWRADKCTNACGSKCSCNGQTSGSKYMSGNNSWWNAVYVDYN